MSFGIAFHLILMHFYFLYSMLWGVFSKIRLFFQKNIFPDFRLIQTIFRSIEISFKNLGELLSISIDWNCFSINRILWIRFFKNGSWLFQKHFFKSFLSFLSLSDSDLASPQFFVVFDLFFLARFLSPHTGKTLLPFFLFVFSHFTHF